MTVFFVPWDTGRNLMEDAAGLYEAAGTFGCVSEGDLVAVKLHVGELGNPHFVPPFFVYRIVQAIKDAGGKPFLTDSNTYYHGRRANAVGHMENAFLHGYGGAPFIAADGLRGENYRLVKTKGAIGGVEVSGAVAEADAMVVVSHCKGHALTGFGGAIKNLGMGCTNAAGKLRQHRTVGLSIDREKCVGCGACRRACELTLPEIVDMKARNDSAECMRCPACRDACPVGAITLDNLENLSKALASAAYGVLSTFGKGKVTYVSFAKDITQFCDCLPCPGKVVMDDIGIFAADSPVSIDAAFLGMADYQQFNQAYGIDCFEQVREAKRLGIRGDLKPKIQQI
jgi:hypothetical protein